jgi:hypothetical protein
VPALDREDMVYDAALARRHTRLLARLAHAYQPLWHVSFHDLYHRFTSVHHTAYLALTRIEVSRRERASQRVPRIIAHASVHCPDRS